jgi:tape measure domain-containing protein
MIGYATVQLIPSFDGLEARANEQLGAPLQSVSENAGKKSGGLFGNGFWTTIGHVMVAAALYKVGQGIASGIGKGISAGLKTASFMQEAEISFETLLGSGGKAQTLIKQLSAFAAKTPFDLQGVTTMTQQLLGAGSAAGDVIPTLTALGDTQAALGGSSDQLSHTMLAWTQLMTRGKIDTQDLLQISNSGIPIWSELAKAIGEPVTSVQDLVASGSLLSADVLPKLQAQLEKDYGGSMAKQAQTLAGVWSTVKDTVTQALGQAFMPLTPWLASVLPGAAQTAANAIIGTSNGIRTAIGGIKTAFGVVSGFFSGTFGSAISTTFSQIGQVVAPFGALIKAAFASLGPSLAQVLPALTPFSTIFQALLPILPPIAGALAQVAGTAIPLLSGVIQAAAPIVTQIVGLLNQFGQILAGVVGRALIQIVPFAQKFIGTVLQLVTAITGPLLSAMPQLFNMLSGPLLSAFTSIMNVGLKGFITLFKTLAPVIIQVVNAFMPFIQQLMSELMPVIMQIVQSLLPPLVALFKALMPVLAPIIGLIGQIVGALAGALVPIIQAIMPLVMTVIQVIISLIQPLVTIITGAINIITGLLTGNWALAWQGCQQIVQGAIDFIVNLAVGLWNILVATFTAIGSTVIAIWNGLWSAVGAALSGAWNFITGVVRTAINTTVNIIGGIRQKVLDVLSGAANWLLGIGRDLINGFINGVKSAWNLVAGAIRNLFGGVVDLVKGILGIHSPSTVMFDMASYTAQGFINGLQARSSDIAKAFGVFAAPSIGGFDPTIGGAGVLGASSKSGIDTTPVAPVQVDAASVLDLIQQAADGRIQLYARATERELRGGSRIGVR